MTIKKQVLIIFILICNFQSFNAQSDKAFEGFWLSRGYGWVVKMNSETITLYDNSKTACYLSSDYPISLFSDDISVKNNVMLLKRGVTQYTFDRISKLPDGCKKKLSKKERKNPILNFEVLWSTFNEQYAYFKERNVDWNVMHSKYRKRINENTTDAELMVVCLFR